MDKHKYAPFIDLNRKLSSRKALKQPNSEQPPLSIVNQPFFIIEDCNPVLVLNPSQESCASVEVPNVKLPEISTAKKRKLKNTSYHSGAVCPKMKKTKPRPSKTMDNWLSPIVISAQEPLENQKKEKKPKTAASGTRVILKTAANETTEPSPSLTQKKTLEIKTRPENKKSTVDKHRDEKLDVLLMNKNNFDFKELMQQYTRRQGLPENTRVFSINGQFEYIKRGLLRREWVENKVAGSQAFHLKWTCNDSEQDYKTLRNGQMFNHIGNNREITTKSGLCNNLRNSVVHGASVDLFFPRCYDLGDTAQLHELKIDYEQTSIVNIVKSHAEYFREYDAPIQIDIDLLAVAMHYCSHLIENITNTCERTQFYPFIKERSVHLPVSQGEIQEMLSYSEITFPFTSFKAHWDYPSETMRNSSISMANYIYSSLPQSKIDGLSNIWIIKPGQNSRGSGVHCVKGLKCILDLATQMKARVIQKYIERPLLIPTTSGMCKFDIRQWVLISSLNPLKVYYYNSNYLRICQSPYTLDDLDPSRHLTNFSVQKYNSKHIEDTVWSLSQFIKHLNTEK